MKPQSYYHCSKAADSVNLYHACRVWNLRATDLNQGVVYGIDTPETSLNKKLGTSFTTIIFLEQSLTDLWFKPAQISHF